MVASVESNLSLSLGWTYGEDGWNTGMDNNIVTLGAAPQLYLKSKTIQTPPGSPSNGDRYYVPSGATGAWSAYVGYVAVYSGFHSAWKFFPVKKGFECRIEDESNNSVWYNGATWVTSVDTSSFLTASSTYTASGVVTFSAMPKISASHTVDTTEIATMGDIDTKIAAINYSTFVRTTGDQTVGGIKTFTSSPVIPDAVNNNEPTAKGQMDTAIAAVTGLSVGTGSSVFKDKSGSNIRLRSIKAGTNVTVTQNADDITISATGGGGGGGADVTANEVVSGEWEFQISSGKNQLFVTDDPTFTAPTYAFGIFHHTANPTGLMQYNMLDTNLGIGSYAYKNDDGTSASVISAKDAYVTTAYDGVSVSSLGLFGDTIEATSGGNIDLNPTGVLNYNGNEVADKAYVLSGTFSGTVTSDSGNTTGGTGQCKYTRVGNIVTVNGYLTVDTNTGSVTTVSLRMTLPVASNFANSTQARGTVTGIVGSILINGLVSSDSTNDQVSFYLISSSAISSSQTLNIGFSFSYEVI